MNLGETIISSFFIHLVLLLLMIAASNYTGGLSKDFRNIVSVDLATDESNISPAVRSDSAVGPPPDSRMPSADEMILPDEPKRTPEPEKKAESTSEPAKIAKDEDTPIQREGATSQEAYYQFIILHKKIFSQKAGGKVNELLGEAFKVNTREFYGGTATVSLEFGPDRKLNKVLVDSVSPELKAFLEEIDWGVLPAPAAYMLRNTVVQMEFSVFEGYMSFKIYAL